MKYPHIIRPLLITFGLLLIPFLGMEVSDEVDWSPLDFVLMGCLIFVFALTFELVVKRASNRAYRLGVALAVVTTFFLIWVNLAVGIIGSEDNPANALYLAIPLIGVIGLFVSRFKARALSYAAIIMATVQFLVPIIAIFVWRPSFDEAPGIVGVFVLNTGFVALFGTAAALLRKAAEETEK